MKERIEIFPGHWIEVTKKIKKAAGLRMSTRVRATLAGGDVDQATKEAARSSNKNVKYSIALLDEAVRIAAMEGSKTAAKVTGVNKWSIDLHMKEKRARSGQSKHADQGHRYTMAQKRACVKLAQKLMAGTETVTKRLGFKRLKVMGTFKKYNHGSAFREAGRRLGINGRSVEMMWNLGMIPMDSPSSPQPPAPPA
jgi:hypothetical protein